MLQAARENTPENTANNVKKWALDTVRYDAQTFAHLQTGYAIRTPVRTMLARKNYRTCATTR
ncbi:hypothetical protein [Paraburkholderia sediminicola]|uniref:hypothetical protein n=1 Tax=Paraburkholderia sediminicola TaxID=458836 RepID=UPI0038BD75FA